MIFNIIEQLKGLCKQFFFNHEREYLPLYTLNITIFLYCVFTLVVVILDLNLNKTIYKKITSFSAIFNGGGSISISLMVSTILCQWTWAASLLQSTTVGTKFGISGSYWYGAGACIQIVLFAIVAIEFKLKAPGAKTFLQFIDSRFDKKTHIIYCAFALLTNGVVSAMLLVGGISILTSSFSNLSSEYSILLFIIAMFGAVYKGLGGLFYVSYFGANLFFLVIIIMFVKVFYSGETYFFGSYERIFSNLNCIKHETNYGGSYLTFLSIDGLMFGIINIIGNFGTVFVDQSYWQLISATTPKKCCQAFIIAGFLWFAIPFCFGTTLSLGYLSMAAVTPSNVTLLTNEEISSGQVPGFVGEKVYGSFGMFLCNLIVIFAIGTTGASEILAVTSIIIHDIYMIYLLPFRDDLKIKDCYVCILCCQPRGKIGLDKCKCCTILYCEECKQDEKENSNNKKYNETSYKCKTHGEYRSYESIIVKKIPIVKLWVTFLLFVIALVLYYLSIDLNWLYLFMGIIIGPVVIPLCLSLFWARINSKAMFYSAVISVFLGVISWLLTTVICYKNLTFESTGKLISMLVGNSVSIGSGGIICILITLYTNKPLNVDQIGEIWEKTRDIDSPLSPWTEYFAKEIDIDNAHKLSRRPSLLEVTQALTKTKTFVWIITIILTLLFIIVIPLIMISFLTFNMTTFKLWIIFGQLFAIFGFIYTLFGPFIEKLITKKKCFKKNSVTVVVE